MAKTISIILGIVFVLVAILGFLGTGLVGDMGLFTTNTLHDIVHLATGIIFLAIAFKCADKAPKAMKVFGIIYLIVAILGFLGVLGFLHINGADNVLHLVLGVAIYALGWWSGKSTAPAPAQSTEPTQQM